MFNDSGKKIKALAKILWWVGLVGSVIGGIVLFAQSYGADLLIGIGFAVMFGGPIVFYVLSLLLYGYGELVDNTAKMLVCEGAKARVPSADVAHPATGGVTVEKNGVQNKTPDLFSSATIGTCDFCGKENVETIKAKVVDEMGTRYRRICAECVEKKREKKN